MTDTLVPDSAGHAAAKDFVARGIVAAALVLFVAFAAEAVPETVAALRSGGVAPDGTLAGALSANVALLLFAWRI